MTRRKGEYSRSRLDREFPYQVILLADRCNGEKGSIMESFLQGSDLGTAYSFAFPSGPMASDLLLRRCGARRSFPGEIRRQDFKSRVPWTRQNLVPIARPQHRPKTLRVRPRRR